ncbi:MAG: Asp-tRNA(Asn)/Glu-tRNA(Gln) amidotransferase subunit GatB [bacterium]|nr:Asp-tRNA(Asn)/Glu-tRNA(Gln) amidotransferase subunit GatB [bacterium]
MNDYLLTIGLEIHAELKTRTKMFCDSKNDTDESRPNTNICPVCLGYPGTLPVINKEAVRSLLRMGAAVGGKLADYTEFDRKNYFYPDIPKGYQISQYKNPLVQGGTLNGVELTRIHLEEDTAKSLHGSNFQFPISNFQSNPNDSISNENSKLKIENSLLDFNRAGVPLMELVTEPVIKSAEEAVGFAKELQLLLKYLNVSGANMEKGEMRVEANISVAKARPLDSKFPRSDLGTKVEVKNINSFRAVGKAIDFEFSRQVALLEGGEKVIQETRGWDENKEVTFSQRLKESAHDYRYFPDPDLPKLFIKKIPDFALEALRRAMPELPWQKRERYKRDFGLKEGDIEIYVREPEWGRLFEETLAILKPARPNGRSGGDIGLAQLTSNYITSDLKLVVAAESLAEVIRMISLGEISSRGAKDILKILEANGGEPRVIAKEKNLIQNSDVKELKTIVNKIIRENPEAVLEYQKGKLASLQFLVGQAMKEAKGNANPQVLKEIFIKIL